LRILKLCYEYPPVGGGGGRIAANLAKELAYLGHHVDLVTMKFRDLVGVERQQGVNIHRVFSFRTSPTVCYPPEMLTYLVGAYPYLHSLICKNSYDLIHSHFIFPDGLLAYALKLTSGLPYIITAHGSDVPGYNPNRFILLHKVLRPVWKLVTEHANYIVSPSRSLSHLIAQQRVNTPVSIVANGFNVGSFDTSRRNDLKVLVVSRMFERKGIQYFLESLENVESPYEIDIVGDGPYLQVLLDKVEKITTKAHIRFHGWLDNDSPQLHSLLEEASIFVFPSESENFPVVLLEAMAAGLAIITTAGTGCEEVVGDTGLLVQPRDAAGIKCAIEHLATNPELRLGLGTAARERVQRLFSWHHIAQQYIGIYQQVMENKH